MPRWGIDLGGTKIEGVVLPDGSSEPICRLRVPTEQAKGYAHIVDQIALLVSKMEAEVGDQRPPIIGMGTPGIVDPETRSMKNANTVCLIGQPLLEDVEAALGARVVAANDANCFALAEATLGAGRGYPTVFGVIMGTGVGGGLVVNGQVLSGLQGIAGEWGHNVVDPNGPDCYCGRRGCVETMISGPALERLYASKSGTRRELREIVSRGRDETDPAAKETLDHLFHWFGRSLAQVINIFDPHAVVLGGGVGNVAELTTRGRDELAKHVFNNRLTTPLLRPQLGDSAGVFGAAMLVPAG